MLKTGKDYLKLFAESAGLNFVGNWLDLHLHEGAHYLGYKLVGGADGKIGIRSVYKIPYIGDLIEKLSGGSLNYVENRKLDGWFEPDAVSAVNRAVKGSVPELQKCLDEVTRRFPNTVRELRAFYKEDTGVLGYDSAIRDDSNHQAARDAANACGRAVVDRIKIENPGPDPIQHLMTYLAGPFASAALAGFFVGDGLKRIKKRGAKGSILGFAEIGYGIYSGFSSAFNGRQDFAGAANEFIRSVDTKGFLGELGKYVASLPMEYSTALLSFLTVVSGAAAGYKSRDFAGYLFNKIRKPQTPEYVDPEKALFLK